MAHHIPPLIVMGTTQVMETMARMIAGADADRRPVFERALLLAKLYFFDHVTLLPSGFSFVRHATGEGMLAPLTCHLSMDGKMLDFDTIATRATHVH